MFCYPYPFLSFGCADRVHVKCTADPRHCAAGKAAGFSPDLKSDIPTDVEIET